MHETFHAERQRGLDEDAHVVGMVAEYIETRASGDDTRLFGSDALQDFLFGSEYFFGG